MVILADGSIAADLLSESRQEMLRGSNKRTMMRIRLISTVHVVYSQISALKCAFMSIVTYHVEE
jgi:hypothetical protein